MSIKLVTDMKSQRSPSTATTGTIRPLVRHEGVGVAVDR